MTYLRLLGFCFLKNDINNHNTYLTGLRAMAYIKHYHKVQPIVNDQYMLIWNVTRIYASLFTSESESVSNTYFSLY